MKGKKGWSFESIRHALASKGVKTKMTPEQKRLRDAKIRNALLIGGTAAGALGLLALSRQPSSIPLNTAVLDAQMADFAARAAIGEQILSQTVPNVLKLGGITAVASAPAAYLAGKQKIKEYFEKHKKAK
jgi:hypothetical protein